MNYSKKILIVDDDEKIISSVIRHLRSNSYQCIGISESYRALDAVLEIMPDVILLDLDMPRISGLGVLRQLKNKANLHHIPIIIMTGIISNELVGEALDLGASGYLQKSYMKEELVSMIQEYI